ncbi:MAG TPA: chemotaxis response regulator protein-glutamate methylesterase [Magnetospirillaceae bacterium]|nr:chemotaxis response regulator protein-glutamate methylesterase [Magnetospirillaceae bacterium]
MNQNPVRVLVVDDSALMRNLVSKIIEATPGLQVADKAPNGIFALQKIPRCDPDVILLDIEMPEMGGLEFLRERMRLGINTPVVILSPVARKGAQVTMEALALGASDFVAKPSGSVSSDVHTIAGELARLLLVYGVRHQKARGRRPGAGPFESLEFMPRQEPRPTYSPGAPGLPSPLRDPGPVELVAIGISTGGPNALRQVFARIDPKLVPPILVVQHMPAGFTEEFAHSLDRICPLDVKEAADGDILKPGRVLIAPGDRHLLVEKRSLAAVARISDIPPQNGHRPSADILFESVAREYGNRALGIIMTGMGRDGARGLGILFREGSRTLGQDEASSVVYGMPKVAFELGHVTEQVPLDLMADRISELARRGR